MIRILMMVAMMIPSIACAQFFSKPVCDRNGVCSKALTVPRLYVAIDDPAAVNATVYTDGIAFDFGELLGSILFSAGANGADRFFTFGDFSDSTIVESRVEALRVVNNGAVAAPACAFATRGLIWFLPGVAGVKDSLMVCAKDAANAYGWRTIY